MSCRLQNFHSSSFVFSCPPLGHGSDASSLSLLEGETSTYESRLARIPRGRCGKLHHLSRISASLTQWHSSRPRAWRGEVAQARLEKPLPKARCVHRVGHLTGLLHALRLRMERAWVERDEPEPALELFEKLALKSLVVDVRVGDVIDSQLLAVAKIGISPEIFHVMSEASYN